MNNSIFSDVATSVMDNFQSFGGGVNDILPRVLIAIVILIIGWIAAVALGKFVSKIVLMTKIDKAIHEAGLANALNQAGIEFSIAKLFGWIVKWFILVAVLITVADTLKLEQINQFLLNVANYIPHIIIAIVILLVGLVLGNFVNNVVRKSVEASNLSIAAGFLATLAKWSIFIFALLASLNQLKIAQSLINTLFTGIIAALAIALGLSFGLGGKDAAKDFIDKLRKEIKE